MTKQKQPTSEKEPRENRVLLPTQRVKPATLKKLERLRPVHRGIGKAIDYCVEAAKE